MAELKLNTEEIAALDNIEAELKGFSPRAKTMAAAEDVADLCKKYHAIRAYLLILIKIVEKIPVYGAKIAAALKFLMSLADSVCPV